MPRSKSDFNTVSKPLLNQKFKKIMNWKNIDLKSDYELSQPILDPYSTETLLLEITCNVRDINRATVTAQFIESLNQNIRTAKEIFADNLDNIVKEATRQRNA